MPALASHRAPFWGCTLLFEKDWYIRTLLRTLQARIENTNQLLKNLSRLRRRSLCSFMGVSTVSSTSRLSNRYSHVLGWGLIWGGAYSRGENSRNCGNDIIWWCRMIWHHQITTTGIQMICNNQSPVPENHVVEIHWIVEHISQWSTRNEKRKQKFVLTPVKRSGTI